MPHALIVGSSGTGKTTLAKRLAETRKKSRASMKNFVQIALDPLASKWPDGVIVVDNWDDFVIELEIAHENGEVGCNYIDEANTHFAHGDKDKLWLQLRGRHFGFDNTLITQYPTLLSPAARGQCERLHLFQIGAQSAKMLADDYAAPQLIRATGLKQGEWLCVEWENGERKVSTYKLF